MWVTLRTLFDTSQMSVNYSWMPHLKWWNRISPVRVCHSRPWFTAVCLCTQFGAHCLYSSPSIKVENHVNHVALYLMMTLITLRIFALYCVACTLALPCACLQGEHFTSFARIFDTELTLHGACAGAHNKNPIRSLRLIVYWEHVGHLYQSATT